jgi:transcriptional regulator with XRE-family HTH domain
LSNDRDRLSSELRRLREAAGVSGREAARKTGLSQSRLSRVERGAFMPTEEEVRALCELYRAPAKLRRELLAVARALQEERESARVILQRGAWRMQERVRQIEEASAHIRTFQPVVIIGLLQTPAYTRQVFGQSVSDNDLEEALNVRAARQQLLHSGRDFTLIMTEGALRWNLGGPDVMVPQLEYLAEATTMPHVRVGVIPWTTAAPLPPLHAFHLYDSRAVIVGTRTATAVITDSRDVVDYEKAFMELERVASFGAAARDVIDRVARDFRSID